MLVREFPQSSRLSLDAVYPAATVTLLFFAFLPIFVGGDALTTSFGGRGSYEISMLAAAGGLSFAYAYLRNMFVQLVGSPPFLCIAALGLWGLVSAFWAINPLLAVAKSVELLLLALATGVLSLAVPTRRKHRIAATVLLAFVGLLVFVNIALWHTPVPFTNQSDAPTALFETLRPRFFMGYAHPLATADFLSIASIFVLYVRRWPLALRLSAFVLLIAGLWLTDGRTPLLGVGVGLLINGFLWLRRPLLRVLLVSGLLAALLAATIYLQGNWLPIVSAVLPPDILTLNGRIGLWNYILTSVLPGHAIIGVGFYSTRNVLLQYADWAGHAHNAYLELLAGLGLIGCLIGIGFLRVWFRAAFKPWNATTLAVGVYLIVHSFMNPLLFTPGLPMMALLLALPSVVSRRGGAEDTD